MEWLYLTSSNISCKYTTKRERSTKPYTANQTQTKQITSHQFHKINKCININE